MEIQSAQGISIEIIHRILVIRLPIWSCSTSISPLLSESIYFLLSLFHPQAVNAIPNETSQGPSNSNTSSPAPGTQDKSDGTNASTHTSSYLGTWASKGEGHPCVNDPKGKEYHLYDFLKNVDKASSQKLNSSRIL